MLKLSIIIPVYNVESYLRECLDSVLSQDMTDYEVICVDDGSTDNSLTILREYESKYAIIKVIQHSENKGLSAARNTGIRQARGMYIQFIDSDDMIKPGTCQLLYQCAKENGVDIVYFNMEFLNDIDSGLIRDKQQNIDFKGIHMGRELFCMYQEAGTLKPEAVRHFIKREFLLINNLFFYEGITHEDMLFSFLVAMKAQRAVDLNCELYIYRQRKGSISWGQKERTASSLFVCLTNICSYWIVNDFSSYENQWIANYIQGIYKNYLYYKGYQNNTCILGGEKERLLQNIFSYEYFTKITFSESDILRLRESKVNILYGAGKVATEILRVLEKLSVRVDFIAVTNAEGNASFLNGISIRKISECTDNTDAVVILGTDEKYHNDIIEVLGKYDFHNYIQPKL